MIAAGQSHAPNKPLAGRRIVVTRARAQASVLCRQIEELGGEPYEFPVIQIAWAEDLAPLDAALAHLDAFDWVVFTSVNAVEMFLERLSHNKKVSDHCQTDPDTDSKKSKPLFAAVGSKTAGALQKAGLNVTVVAEEFVAEGLVDALGDRVQPGQKVLLPRANIARKNLPAALRKIGCDVTEVELYRTLPLTDNVEDFLCLLAAKAIDFITFTSSSTVKNFLQALHGQKLDELLAGVALFAIGPVTAQTVSENGLSIAAMPEEYTIDGLVSTMVDYCKQLKPHHEEESH